MALVKSHSNYVLKSKHQNISDGTIYERDITTIGGLNQFSSSVTPIYKSGNFIITVRSDSRSSNEYNTIKFEPNQSGTTTWTMQTVSSMTSDYEDDNDTKIVLKQDYYDFCDFAYYGSLSELFRASITDIISRFPGELYGIDYNVFYTKYFTVNFEKVEERFQIGGMGSPLKALDNPFGIDLHSLSLPADGNALKFFADSGYTNYDLIKDNKTTPITKWNSQFATAILPSETTLEDVFGEDDFYNDVLKDIFANYRNKYDFLAYNTINTTSGIIVTNSEGYNALRADFSGGTIHTKMQAYINGDYKYRIHESESGVIVQHFKTLGEVESWLKEQGDKASGYTVSSGVKCDYCDGYVGGTQCIGEYVGKVTLNEHTIYVYVGENYDIEYLYDSEKDSLNDFHIRPNQTNISKFYNECDNFEKILMNRKSTPRYKSTFSVMRENSHGYYRQMEEFVFPTTYGDYNLSTESYGLTTYTKRLVEIGEFYDEYFTDNLYRSMTHEAIKNFDWTYTREFHQGDDEEFIEGGEKIQKTLRLIAREFDEVKSYIDAMKNTNCITYDERSNIPDYFLTDVIENDGWDVKLVYPFKSDLGNNWDVHSKAIFSQMFSGVTQPYSKSRYSKKYTTEGFFVTCCEDEKTEFDWSDIDCRYQGSESRHFMTSDGKSTYFDQCANIARNRIRPYLSDEEYSYKEVNNEFLRRLAINSPYIFRHKGTIEGLEMILGMFGLKSKRYVDLINKPCFPNINADYNITEYTRFAQPYTDKWEDCHMMHTIDWYNSTKTITYDNRSESNYTLYGANAASDYSTYQGLPVLCRWEDENDKTKPWYLYPNFDKDDELDGNPYFQMNGGWEQKKYNDTYFQFDRDGYIVSATTPLYKETLLSVKRVDSISDLLSIPQTELYDNFICYVTNIEKDIAVVNGTVYDINYDSNGAKYIKFTMQGGGIKVGNDRYFDNDIVVYDCEYEKGKYTYTETTYSLLNMPDGYTIKAYINDNPSEDEEEFVCKSLEEGPWYFKSFMQFNPTYGTAYAEDMSNYFILKYTNYNTSLAYYDKETSSWSEDGWERLSLSDERLIQVRASENYFDGNNPHSGRRIYDNGEEYYEYFKHFFKYACENELFDERCHQNFYDVVDALYESGFTVDSADTIDTKVHYFGHYHDTSGKVYYYCDEKTVQCKEKYDAFVKQIGIASGVSAYTLNSISPYLNKSKTNDESVNQIMNNKRLTLTFYVDEQNLLEQIKYLDYIVMNYVSQMIPSATILDIVYTTKKE